MIVEFAGQAVTDLNTYSAALYAMKPGDVVTITFIRAGTRHTVKATLGRRGG